MSTSIATRAPLPPALKIVALALVPAQIVWLWFGRKRSLVVSAGDKLVQHGSLNPMAKAFNFPQNFGKRLSPIAPTFTPKISSLFSPFAKSFVPDSKSSIGHSKLSEVARSYKVFVPSAPGVPEFISECSPNPSLFDHLNPSVSDDICPSFFRPSYGSVVLPQDPNERPSSKPKSKRPRYFETTPTPAILHLAKDDISPDFFTEGYGGLIKCPTILNQSDSDYIPFQTSLSIIDPD